MRTDKSLEWWPAEQSPEWPGGGLDPRYRTTATGERICMNGQPCKRECSAGTLCARLAEDDAFPYPDEEHRMNIGSAVQALKAGHTVARKGWDFALRLTDGEMRYMRDGEPLSPIVMVGFGPADLLADDWELVE